SEVVVTGGSTVGVEAVFWGRPSVLIGPSGYDELDVVHGAHDAASLEALLRRPLPGVKHEAALAYGYYRATFGEPFVVYQPTTFSLGTFAGQHLRPLAWRALASARLKFGAMVRERRDRFGGRLHS
ncbi:MAG: hypothetical protein H0X64_10145, partial [Gemmatimonadaceae bacterium]|nr:hypothetical protein [Gemmatimonadaceae bacterium]